MTLFVAFKCNKNEYSSKAIQVDIISIISFEHSMPNMNNIL